MTKEGAEFRDIARGGRIGRSEFENAVEGKFLKVFMQQHNGFGAIQTASVHSNIGADVIHVFDRRECGDALAHDFSLRITRTRDSRRW